MQDFVFKKIEQSKEFLKNTVGLKPVYFENDVFKIFTKFGYVENLTLDEAYFYLPSKGYSFDSIESFTKGFITGNNYKMYAIRMGHHFNIFVVSYNMYKEMESYYSVTISNETMEICYILEAMVK